MQQGRAAACLIAAIVCFAVASQVAGAASLRFTARVKAPPTVQIIGLTYTLKVSVRNSGPWVKNFCLDFTDDNNSWLIRMPGLRAYDSDTFCTRFLRRGLRVFTARVIPGKAGVHKMSITLGGAEFYATVNDAIITDDNALYWEDQFILR